MCELVWWLPSVIAVLGKMRQEDCFKFKANLGNRKEGAVGKDNGVGFTNGVGEFNCHSLDEAISG